MCVHGGVCSTVAPGHALHLIQARLAAATPSEWSDAIVESVDVAARSIVVRALTGGESVALWSGAGAAAIVRAGDPVALHARYDVLAIGAERFNVLRG